MNFFNPKEAMDHYSNGSARRVENHIGKIFLLAVFAGVFIAFGASGSSVAAHTSKDVGISRLVMGTVFPVGLIMVVITGAELFTGDCLFIISALKKKISFWKMLKMLVIVYTGNLAGGILIALLVYLSGQFSYSDGLMGAYTIKLAAGKTSLSFLKAFCSGILCNILVCTAVFMAVCAKNIIGKIFCCYFPIFVFVISGYEHCVANMYYIPAGIFACANELYQTLAMQQYGISAEQIAGLNWESFLIGNLLPVTLGNIVGRMVFFAIPLMAAHQGFFQKEE